MLLMNDMRESAMVSECVGERLRKETWGLRVSGVMTHEALTKVRSVTGHAGTN